MNQYNTIIKTWDLVSVIFIHPSSYHHATVQPQCIPQHMCALIYQYNKIIIKDNKYLYASITDYVTIAMSKSLLKQRHRDTKNHGEMIDCITYHVCQEIQGGRWDGDDDVDEGADDGVDDVLAGGGWSPLEVILAAVPPSDLHRRRPAASLFWCFRSTPPPPCDMPRGNLI